MSSPPLSRQSSFASISSIFSTPTDYVLLPEGTERLYAKLSQLKQPDNKLGDWKTIASTLSDILCDPYYRLKIATYMNVYTAVWRIDVQQKATQNAKSPREHLHHNLEVFLSAYVEGVAEVAEELRDNDDPERRNDFLRERRARYLQVMRYASHMLAYHDRHYVTRENAEKYHGSLPPVKGIFHIAWSRGRLPTFEGGTEGGTEGGAEGEVDGAYVLVPEEGVGWKGVLERPASR